MHTLAEKIAGAAGSTHEISLDVKNISTLSPLEATAVGRELQRELNRRGLLLTRAFQSEAQVQVTFSDRDGGRLLIFEFRHGTEHQINFIPAPRVSALLNDGPREALTLTAKLVWEQPERVLDFLVFDGIPDLQSNLLVVEADRLAFYHLTDSRWIAVRAIPIPRFRPAPRDLRAQIDVERNEIRLPDAQCSGRVTNADEIRCRSLGGTKVWWMSGAYFPGHEGSLMTILPQKCGEGKFILASGMGDWTQPDSLQPFEQAQSDMPPVSAGNTIYFDGPILSLVADKGDDAIRVVVHNLKTGNYEAYIVTATCSH